MGRAPCCDKANVKKGPWSPEEDVKLKTYIQEHGTGSNWIALPQKIGLKRCGKSCRLRWLNYLRPDIRHGSFSEEEDQIICSLYISIGSRWSIIAAQLPGRTDNDIKNYWNTKLKKKLLGRRKDTQSSTNGSDPDSPNSQTLSSMALERMQLHLQLQGLQNPFSLWPAFNPLFYHDQQVAATIAAGLMNQDRNKSSVPLVSDTTIMYAPMEANMQEEVFHNSNLNGVGGGIPAERLQGTFLGQECNINQLAELDSFQDAAKENVNWWTMNCFDEKSSSSSWDSASSLQPNSVFQEYVLGYDL